MDGLESMFFFQLTLLFYNLVLTRNNETLSTVFCVRSLILVQNILPFIFFEESW